MEIPDLSSRVYAPEMHIGAVVRAVGWLGNQVPRQGQLSLVVLDQLQHYSSTSHHDDYDMGDHCCELCGLVSGHGEFWIEWNAIRYVLPSLMVHYCEAHGYLPPDDFLAALTARWASDNPLNFNHG